MSSWKTLVFGSTGMLGQALRRTFRDRGAEFVGSAITGSDCDVDLTERNEIVRILEEVRPEIVINAAAMTDCNACDRDFYLAYRVNARPSGVMADWARNNGAFYVYISTDHYFTGHGDRLHDESAPVVLLNDYARTKYVGEVMALTNPEALVVRTNIVGFRGWESPTFVEWAISALKSREPMTLFDDYYTSSISVSLFSEFLFDLVAKKPKGVVNLAAREPFSKKKFVEALADGLGLPRDHVKTGTVASLQTCRAESLGLNVAKAETLLGRKLPTLQEVVERLCIEYKERTTP